MSFRTKIIIFTSAIGILLTVTFCYLSKNYLESAAQERFLKNYENSMALTGDMFLQLESASSLLGLSAARALSEHVQHHGLPPNEQLPELAKKLNVSHIFATDRNGKFIRSTNGRIEDYKNTLFDYCASYRQLVDGKAELFETPIIPSADEAKPGPFKYIMIPNANRSGVLEVSIPLDFIQNLIANVLREDPNYLSLEIKTPTGNVLGKIDHGGDSSEFVKLDRRIALSNMSQCCECKVKNITQAGAEYWYDLTAKVSTQPLKKELAAVIGKIILAGVGGVTLSLILSFLLSATLSKNVWRLKTKLEEITEEGDIKRRRVPDSGKDEFSFIGNKINGLLAAIERQDELIKKSEREKATALIAKQVAHDLRSPLTALQVASENPIFGIDLIKASIKRINEIASDLRTVSKDNAEQLSSERKTVRAIDIINDVLAEKKAGLEKAVVWKVDDDSLDFEITVHPGPFKRAISNIITNSIEAVDIDAQIVIAGSSTAGLKRIEVTDNGAGIPLEIRDRIFDAGYTSKSGVGSGLGLYQAKTAVEADGGKIENFNSESGTTFSIVFEQSKA